MIEFDYLSFGAGVQTTALLFLEKEGKISFKKAIFADTGAETEETYDLIKKLHKLFPGKIVETSYGHIVKDTFKEKYITAPVFTDKIVTTQNLPKRVSVIGRRSCTYRYKIYPVQRKIRELENLQRKRLPAGRFKIGLGFSTDEYWRAKKSRVRWIENVFPLLKLKLKRKDCLRILKKNNLKVPRSACYFCPLRSGADWKLMQEKDPKEWKKAVEFDKKIRNLKSDSQNFIHASGVPLDKIEFHNPEQMNLFALNDCESGYCGT